AIQAIDLGAFDYVIKPDDFQSLVRELQSLIPGALQSGPPARAAFKPAEAPAAEGPLLVVKGKAMKEVIRQIGLFAKSDDVVLIRGETGTGKELVAKALHTYSRRRGQPFVPLNCAAIPENLSESELFGHDRGSFTGAERARAGKFVSADGG